MSELDSMFFVLKKRVVKGGLLAGGGGFGDTAVADPMRRSRDVRDQAFGP